MLHSTAVFPPIYNGLVCWEILNIILLFKSMFEEIWNRKINKSYVWNESHWNTAVSAHILQMMPEILHEWCHENVWHVWYIFPQIPNYYIRNQLFFFAVGWAWFAQVIFMLKVEGKKVCWLLLLWAHFPRFHYFRPTCIFPWAPQAYCGVYLKDAINSNKSITHS